MRYLPILIVLFLAACGPADKEVFTASVDVHDSAIPALLAEVDGLTDGGFPVGELIALAEATPIDEELEQRFTVSYQGVDEEIQVHIWRDQVDWVHLYFSTTSKDLNAAFEEILSGYATSTDG